MGRAYHAKRLARLQLTTVKVRSPWACATWVARSAADDHPCTSANGLAGRPKIKPTHKATLASACIANPPRNQALCWGHSWYQAQAEKGNNNNHGQLVQCGRAEPLPDKTQVSSNAGKAMPRANHAVQRGQAMRRQPTTMAHQDKGPKTKHCTSTKPKKLLACQVSRPPACPNW